MYFHVVMINVYYASAWPDWHKAQGNGMKRSTLGITRSKFKVTRDRRWIWRLSWGVILNSLWCSSFPSCWSKSG